MLASKPMSVAERLMTDCRVRKACTAIKIAKLISLAFFRTTLIDITVKIFDLFVVKLYKSLPSFLIFLNFASPLVLYFCEISFMCIVDE